MAIERLVGHFGAVADPRCRGKVEHRLTDILVIAVCAVIACAESWNDIALYQPVEKVAAQLERSGSMLTATAAV